MSALVSQITILTIVYFTIYSRRSSKKTSQLRVNGLCAGSEFPAQRANNAENVSIWWRHHVTTNGVGWGASDNWNVHVEPCIVNNHDSNKKSFFAC